ncbi:MAG: hypothetical protein IKK09_03455 [Clostridia bacterium]|nr:hypothetical protein [Clostridia bacterium]
MTLTVNPVSTSAFGTMEDRQKVLKKKRVKDFLNIGMIATVFFIVADFVPLYIKWDAVQTDNWYFVALLAAVSAVILDLPMFLAGKKIKEYQDRLISKSKMIPTVVLAAIAFLVAYIPFFIFSIATKDATFQEALSISSSSTISFDTNGTTVESNPLSVSIAAIFSAVLPLGTSISSLVCGITTYHPAEDKLNRLEEVRLLACNHRSQLLWGKAQLSDRKKLLISREKDLLESHINETKAQELIRIQAYEEALEEKLDADGILRVTENAFSYIDESPFTEECNPDILNALNDPILEESKGISSTPVKADFINTDVA